MERYKIVIDLGERSKESALFYMEEFLKCLKSSQGVLGCMVEMTGFTTLEAFDASEPKIKYHLESDKGYMLSGDPKVMLNTITPYLDSLEKKL